VADDAAGQTSVSNDSIEYFEARHRFSPELGRRLAAVDRLVAQALGVPD
jgi:hypothetical protein